MHYYPHHIGDFIKDTNFLSNEEIGIYMKLIWIYYDSEKPLKNNISALAMKTNAKGLEDSLQEILNLFFVLENDEWHHARCDKEIAVYHDLIVKKSKAGKASAESKKNKSTTVEHTKNISDSTEQQTNNQEPRTNNQELITKEKTISKESAIPPCPHDEIIFLYHQILPELPRVVSWTETRKSYLKQRWRQLFAEFECKTSEQGLEWFKTDFFPFIKDSKFLTGRVESKDRKPFVADLEWVIKPTNFTKIIEGKYK